MGREKPNIVPMYSLLLPQKQEEQSKDRGCFGRGGETSRGEGLTWEKGHCDSKDTQPRGMAPQRQTTPTHITPDQRRTFTPIQTKEGGRKPEDEPGGRRGGGKYANVAATVIVG